MDTNQYSIRLDELNRMADASVRLATDASGNVDEAQVEDDVLSLLIEAYREGVATANEQLDTSIDVELDELEEAIFVLIDGKTFDSRLKTHLQRENIGRVQSLVESEYQRVFNRAVQNVGVTANSIGKPVSKTWITMMDDRVRDTHDYLQGMTIPVEDEFYTYDGDHALSPHGFRKVENNANCRCFLSLTWSGKT